MPLIPVRRESTVEAILDQLQAQFVSGVWQIGQRIPGELDLAAQLNVSRPAVREAIRALAYVGVLEVRRGDGTYLRTITDPRPLLRGVQRASLRDVFEVQQAYDAQAARLAALRRTDIDLDRLETLLAARDAAPPDDPATFGAADSQFHLAVVETSRNAVLIEAYRFFLGRLRESLQHVRADHELREAGPAPHHAVLAAIRAGDPDAAASAAHSVVEPTLSDLRALLADDD